MGRVLAEKVNRYAGPVSVLLPLRAISVIGGRGQVFHDAEADECLFQSIRKYLDPRIPRIELDHAINDPEFAQACTLELLKNIRNAGRKRPPL
jgi:uncharacterized protein (UPF0261 family)